jgi:hypothetical protein
VAPFSAASAEMSWKARARRDMWPPRSCRSKPRLPIAALRVGRGQQRHGTPREGPQACRPGSRPVPAGRPAMKRRLDLRGAAARTRSLRPLAVRAGAIASLLFRWLALTELTLEPLAACAPRSTSRTSRHSESAPNDASITSLPTPARSAADNATARLASAPQAPRSASPGFPARRPAIEASVGPPRSCRSNAFAPSARGSHWRLSRHSYSAGSHSRSDARTARCLRSAFDLSGIAAL